MFIHVQWKLSIGHCPNKYKETWPTILKHYLYCWLKISAFPRNILARPISRALTFWFTLVLWSPQVVPRLWSPQVTRPRLSTWPSCCWTVQFSTPIVVEPSSQQQHMVQAGTNHYLHDKPTWLEETRALLPRVAKVPPGNLETWSPPGVVAPQMSHPDYPTWCNQADQLCSMKSFDLGQGDEVVAWLGGGHLSLSQPPVSPPGLFTRVSNVMVGVQIWYLRYLIMRCMATSLSTTCPSTWFIGPWRHHSSPLAKQTDRLSDRLISSTSIVHLN